MGYTARDIMSTEVICVHEETDLRDLAKMFLEQGITGAPVVDKDGNLVGVISQTDLLYYQLTRDDELILNSDFYSSVRVEGRTLPSGFQIDRKHRDCLTLPLNFNACIPGMVGGAYAQDCADREISRVTHS